MKPCWNDHGLTEKGASKADKVLPDMLDLFEKHKDDLGMLKIVFAEAMFRYEQLPTRDTTWVRQYLEKNGEK